MADDNILGGLQSDIESLRRDVDRFENTLGELDKDIKALGWRTVYGAAAICGLGLLLALLVYNMLSDQVGILADNVAEIDSKVVEISTRVAVIETRSRTMESSLSRIETALGELALKVDGSARFDEPDLGGASVITRATETEGDARTNTTPEVATKTPELLAAKKGMILSERPELAKSLAKMPPELTKSLAKMPPELAEMLAQRPELVDVIVDVILEAELTEMQQGSMLGGVMNTRNVDDLDGWKSIAKQKQAEAKKVLEELESLADCSGMFAKCSERVGVLAEHLESFRQLNGKP